MKRKSSLRGKILSTAVSSIALLPSAFAVDWDGAAGLFGEPTNWVDDAVPDGQEAVIANGGTASITTGNDFSVTTLAVGGHDGSGSVLIDGGSLTLLTRLMIGGDDANEGTGIGSVTMTSGTLQAVGGQESWIGTKGGNGTLILSGDATLSNNQQIHFGRDTGGVGTGIFSGISQFSATRVGVGVFSGTTSTVTVKESATFSVSSGDGALNVGWNTGTSGVFNIQDSATVNVVGQARIGNEGGHGTLTMTGGTLNLFDGDGYFVAGRTNGGTGVVTISGDSVVNISKWMMAGAGGGASSGTITVNNDATVNAERITVAFENDASGIYTINGGTVTTSASGMPGVIVGGGGNGANRQLNLNGGTLATNQIGKNGGDATVAIKFNGGTIKAVGESFDFFRSGAADGSSLGITSADLEIQSGGLIFDTNGFFITITQGLNGVGGLTKEGEGTLMLTDVSGYEGDTMILGGILSVTSGSLFDSSNVWLAEGTAFDLDFTGADTINALVIGGVAQEIGIWGSFESDAVHKSDRFSGLGVLNVTSAVVPEPSTMALCLGALGVMGEMMRLRRRRKQS